MLVIVLLTGCVMHPGHCILQLYLTPNLCLANRMHHVVLDEADLLLSGAYERDVQRILDGMKQSARERKAQQVSKELGIPLEAFQALPRHLKAAAYEGGLSLIAAVSSLYTVREY